MLRRVIFDRDRAYAALKQDPGSCQNAKRASFGLSVNKMRAGGLFWERVGEAHGAQMSPGFELST